MTIAKYCYTVAKPGPYMYYYSTVNTTAAIYYCSHQTAAAYVRVPSPGCRLHSDSRHEFLLYEKKSSSRASDER